MQENNTSNRARPNKLPATRLDRTMTRTADSRASAQRAAMYAAQSQLELARLAHAEDLGSPIRACARELADTLGELVARIQGIAERSAR
jgi:hypothetical protein